MALRDAGVVWTPTSGDRFAITRAEMADETFVLADMTIELHHLPDGDLIGFNGTTEWALDSVEPEHAVWLPNESQLRELLGRTFHSLQRGPAQPPKERPPKEKSANERAANEGPPNNEPRSWRVTVTVNGQDHDYTDIDAASAYAKALLGLIAD